MLEKLTDRAILIYPEFDTADTFWSYAHSLKHYAPLTEFGTCKRLLPPLGLMGLYNHLKPYYHSIQLIDKNIDPRPLDPLIKQADHVYMGGMLAQEQHLLKHAKTVKQYQKRLIIGGTAIHPDSPLIHLADHVIENEAEGVINQLLEDIKKNHKTKYYQGVISSVEDFFQPDFEAINLDHYVHMAIQISRGCPEACEFCDIPSRFGKAFRVTPWEKTEQSFRQIYELGWKGQVFIVDDNFIANPRKALEILKNLYAIGEKIGYHHPKYTELTLRIADQSPIMEELRRWYQKAHFINGFYGVETPNEASLKETRKKQNLRGERSIQEKLHFISKKTGSGVMMGMIYGFDHDTTESINEFISFVNNSHAPIVMAGLLNALPSTGLIKRMQAQGRFIQLSSGNNSDGVINFIPYHFSIQQAEQNYLKILHAIYHPKAYFRRVMRHLQLINPEMQTNYRSQADKYRYLFRILSRKNAWIYWRYLPSAINIARQRTEFNSPAFHVILAEYFSLCGQYTHFSIQINNQKQKLKRKQYQSWEQESWLNNQAKATRLSNEMGYE